MSGLFSSVWPSIIRGFSQAWVHDLGEQDAFPLPGTLHVSRLEENTAAA